MEGIKEKKTDRRIRKTKQQLQEGFIHLRKTKSIKYITVKELCELTDLNRGTFYLHYKDIYDLSEQMENEIILKFEEALNSYSVDGETSPQTIMCKAFEIIKENADFCTCLLSNTGEMTFFNKLKTIIRDGCFQYWTELFSKPKKVETFDYFFNFMLYGCIGIIESWLNSGLKESPQEMAQLASKVMLNGVTVLHKFKTCIHKFLLYT